MNHLLIFVKNPIEGKVKTRLGAEIGHSKAVEVYKALLNYTKKITLKCPVERIVYYGDFIPEKDLWSDGNYKKSLQEGENLGERMENAIAERFTKKAKKVIIIGSDCPDLSDEIIEAAFIALDNHDVVFGPAMDGGYYLAGMKACHKDFFYNKSWSTETVLEDTLADAERLGLSISTLPVLSDIDTVEDLKLSGWAKEFNIM